MDRIYERERVLLDRIVELERALDWAEAEARIDGLTCALNRRGWERLLDAEEERCKRHGLDAVVVAVDLDELKGTNDGGGHPAGDRLLIACVRAIKGTMRASDAVARTGGDEFGVLALQTAADSGSAVPSRVAHALEAAQVKATLGCGRRSQVGSLRQAWHQADRRMLAAKPAGRDRR